MKRLLVRRSTRAARLEGFIAHLFLQKLERPRFRDDLGTAAYVEFSTDVQDVFLDRVHTEDKVTGDLPVGSAMQ